MKKLCSILIATILVTSLFAGCTGGNAPSEQPSQSDTPSSSVSSNTEISQAASTDFDSSQLINAVSREDGSGTRGAFIELFGVEQKDADGKKVDMTTEDAFITNNTSVMLTTVAGDPYAIGYVSLGSLGDTVKAVNVDGVEATAENIKNGTYKISRPFNVATKDTVSEVSQDFIAFILSPDGQAIVEASGYISAEQGAAYSPSGKEGKIVIAGSSSVTPVMEKLKEGYLALNPNVEIEIQQSDSTTGMTSAIDGICDIGMASRELKDSELEKGLKPTVIAMDGIAVIVSQENPLNDITSEQVKSIFTGETTEWSELALG